MRKALPWVIAAIAILVAAAVVARPYIVRVPQATVTLRVSRQRLESAGLEVRAVRVKGGGKPVNADAIVSQSPAAGSVYLKGLSVTVNTEPSSEIVEMPDLIGRFAADAQKELTHLDLEATVQGSPSGGGVVVSQEPSPGVAVRGGTAVTYRAVFPHTPSGIATEVASLHGVTYLRYGFQGAIYCNPCHDASTCTGGRCHSGGAFSRLASMTPLPH